MVDEWGRDPSVRHMRAVFAGMKGMQDRIVASLALNPFDHRLRRAREGALHLFERIWPKALREDLAREADGAAILYAHCFARALTASGITVPSAMLPRDRAIEAFLDGVHR